MTDPASEATTFDALFGDLPQADKDASTAQGAEEKSPGQPTSDLGGRRRKRRSTPLEELPGFYSLVEIASARGFVPQDEIISQLPNEYLEDFFNYAVDHQISVLEIDLSAYVPDDRPDEQRTQQESGEIDLLHLYQREAGKFPLLSADEEEHLARKIEQGKVAAWKLSENEMDEISRAQLEERVRQGEDARRRFVEANLRLVVHWAMKHRGRGLSVLDLIQEGNLGLMKAVEDFDYREGCRFSTYGSWWIRQKIRRAIADQSRVIRLPVHMHDKVRHLRDVTRQVEKRLGRAPNLDETTLAMGLLEEKDTIAVKQARAANEEIPPVVLARLNKAREKVELISKAAHDTLSLEMAIDGKATARCHFLGRVFGPDRVRHARESQLCLHDLVVNELVCSPLDAVTSQLLSEHMCRALDHLDCRERRIIEMRFGIVDGRRQTLEEIGQKMNLTRERIRQIEGIALRKLKHPVWRRGLVCFLKPDRDSTFTGSCHLR